MRSITLALILSALASPAFAQVGDQRDLLVRDRSGRVMERLEPQRDGVYVRRDSRGNYLGTIETDRTGSAILRAPGGRVQGTAELRPEPPPSRQ